MIDLERIRGLVGDYDLDNVVIATVCSHSSLQIFDGARKEGFRTLGLCVGDPPRFYDAFPRAKPDEFLSVNSYPELLDRAEDLLQANAVVIPHGSLVEYLGSENFEEFSVPTFGNRRVLNWESNRERERVWLERAGVTMPRRLSDPADISGPVMVKYHGAKGGSGFFVAKTYEEFEERIDDTQPYTIQEFILGTRYYLHYFYSPITDAGYRLSKGTLELLSRDRRVESNADEVFRLGAPRELESSGITPTFVVTGNVPLVARESLMPKIFEMGEAVVEESLGIFGGMIGPFCLETVLTDELEFRVFEISARIVAGTNFFVSGSPYADLIYDGMSTGRRIAREIKLAIERDLLFEVIS
ncbi:5-formaminoimidazole-4-carboxamide-1-(beta)-D-ribofuranosyl 5'-monophosphate synthetase [Methanosarcinales archaeon]|nr:MAG: 5-formaminoimidazole-4-carboxamide-1-(beta)-D-ribofuranosyl 5'-monophosphate synthetase [Methanosarcinales archaeon]